MILWTLFQSLCVAVVAAWLTSFLIEKRESNKTARGLKYLALQIAFQLEHFAAECASSFQDAGNYENSNGDMGRMLEALPELSAYPQDGDYAAFDTALLTQVLSFRLKVDSANSSVIFEYNANGEDSAHDACMAVCLKMGVDASKLSDKVREAYKLAPFELEKTLWDYREYLEQQRRLRQQVSRAIGRKDS
ncbi:hypothetical protein PUN4_320020 [Paraburkholderia unamae]|uniref:hypothetical protein n=1 Tax=Paraburkholderia unamae TaxID=219649 RepID=UPI001CAC5768|nr:hypothetical protein [Paraburkholderia unamae]CAG9258541.1 hypothetical protein PUN4_320020 [Paraburkholderia unamae]